jgi:hypothetical protein
MTTTLRLRVAGSVPIHGKKPGEDFAVPIDDDGVPLSLLWRKRLADGSVARVLAAPSEPVTAPAPPAKKKDA